MDDINLGLYPRPRLCPLGLMTNCGLYLRCGATMDTFLLAFATFHPILLATLAQNWCAPPKSDLKWHKIHQVTNSKLYYNIIKSIDR